MMLHLPYIKDIAFDVTLPPDPDPLCNFLLHNAHLRSASEMLAHVHSSDDVVQTAYQRIDRLQDRVNEHRFHISSVELPFHFYSEQFIELTNQLFSTIPFSIASARHSQEHLVCAVDESYQLILASRFFEGFQFDDMRNVILQKHPHIALAEALFSYYQTQHIGSLYPFAWLQQGFDSDFDQTNDFCHQLVAGNSFDECIMAFHPYVTHRCILHLEHLSDFLDTCQCVFPHFFALKTDLLEALANGEIDPVPYVSANYLYTDIDLLPPAFSCSEFIQYNQQHKGDLHYAIL